MKYNKILYKVCWALTMGLALMSCSTESLPELDRTKADFLNHIDGAVSPLQWWRTAVPLQVNVTTDATAQLWLMSGKDTGHLYDYKKVTTSGMVEMLAPQGQSNPMYLVSICRQNRVITPITLTGETDETINLRITSSSVRANADDDNNQEVQSPHALVQSTMSSVAKDVAGGRLYGKSLLGNAKQRELTDDQRKEGISVLDNYYIEKVPAKELGLNCDYELKSKGDFDIIFFAGNCLSAYPHVLGYYYHSPGTYSDIQYVDISEIEVYDYIDGLPKVQYKVNDAVAQQYGVKANYWYDANFDIYDLFTDAHPAFAERRNDDVYNTMAIYDRYGHNITNIRGLSFTIKVPAGKCVGFYNRIEDTPAPEQYDRFVRRGIRPYTTREEFKAMNLTCEAMNENQDGSYRSSIIETDHAYWLGMENIATGGDLDCNDVMFAITADMEIYRPSIIEPDLRPTADYTDVMPWTIAYEDVYRNADFDFNDAVIKLLPNHETQECCVTVMAAGSPSKMYLHYDGPNGDENLGEIHELLSGETGKCINTQTTNLTHPFTQVACVKWPSNYTMQNDAKRFYIEVQRGTCENCSDVITLPDTPGDMPQALLIAGEWKWPKEGVNIMKAYDAFPKWSKDVTQQVNWNWYSNSKPNTCVNY